MKIIRAIKEMSGFSRRARLKNKTIGFVPTMGALHAGHLSLIKAAGRQNNIVVVSIFVNPIQFGPREDYRHYPRNLKQDVRLCGKSGVDVVFYPSAREVYPPGYRTYVSVEALGDVLCGKARKGHFGGVATVVMKLLNIIRPDIMYLGQKDAQQAVIITKMVEDLNVPCRVKIMPTIREKDGLAMSSRNAYLNKEQRQQAAVLYKALLMAKDFIRRGNKDARKIIARMRNLINKEKSSRIEYISIVRPLDLKPVGKIREKVLIALAVRIGRTRLIDNIIVS